MPYLFQLYLSLRVQQHARCLTPLILVPADRNVGRKMVLYSAGKDCLILIVFFVLSTLPFCTFVNIVFYLLYHWYGLSEINHSFTKIIVIVLFYMPIDGFYLCLFFLYCRQIQSDGKNIFLHNPANKSRPVNWVWILGS